MASIQLTSCLMLNRQKRKKLTRWIALEIDKYNTKEKLPNIKQSSLKIKNLGWLGPDRPRNIVTTHALKTKLKSSDVKKTLKAFIKDPR